MDAAIGKTGGDTERTGAPHAFWAGVARSVLPLLSLIVSGCSIHPVQQDVTGVKPKDLVNFIRCEARLAIQDKAIEMLRGETSARAWGIRGPSRSDAGTTLDF